MRIFVKFRDESGKVAETYAIVCNDQLEKIDSLKRKTLSRVPPAISIQNAAKFQLAVAPSGASLSSDDLLQEVLKDGDFVCMWPLEVPYQEAEGIGSALPSYGISVCRKLVAIKNRETIELDGESLTIEDLIKIGRGDLRVKLSDRAVQEVEKGRKVVDDAVAEGKIIYGVTTGFGKFADTPIPPEQVVELQENLIRSHAAGVGPPLNMELTRMILTLRINVLAKGFSGVRLVTLQALIDALNASCLPLIPEQGTVGASGDLAPLAHLALGMMGEGLMWSPESGWDEAKNVLAAHGLQPITLKAKEGLALINGTQLITALGAEAVYRAENIAREADVVAALTLQALEGTPVAYDKDIHVNRPHRGQNEVAKRLRALLCSEKYTSDIKCGRKQDPYTLRCVPQVHGVVHETLTFVKGIIETEMNSAQDNPMVFADRNLTLSGGNFHGEYPAKAVDYLAIGIHELANISERRMEKLTNAEPVKGTSLPPFLIKEELGGLNNGFMIAQYTAAALVSENKVLTHPASVDSVSTCAGQEDHVSMGGYGARKALRVVSHVEQVLAIELLGACQGMEFIHRKGLHATEPLEKVYHLVRQHVEPWVKDRFMAPDIEAATKLLKEGMVWEVVEPYVQDYQE